MTIGLSEMIARPAVVSSLLLLLLRTAGQVAWRQGRAEGTFQCDCAGPPNYRRRPQCWREVLARFIVCSSYCFGVHQVALGTAVSRFVPGLCLLLLVLMFVATIGYSGSFVFQPWLGKSEPERIRIEAADEAAQAVNVENLIQPKDVVIMDLLVEKVFREKPNEWSLTGTIVNSSQHILTELNVEFILSSCWRTVQPPCPVVGQQTIQITPVAEIPPRKARSFQQSVEFPKLPVAVPLTWKYRVKGTRAKPVGAAE
jgi:hypothetical protein